MSFLKISQEFITKISLFLSVVCVASEGSVKTSYSYIGIWTGDNTYSSAPHPTCQCDINPNEQDCPLQSTVMNDVGEFCYDEFIPYGSTGYVHAGVFQRSSDQ